MTSTLGKPTSDTTAAPVAWPLGIRIRPAVDVRLPDAVEVSDTVTGRRFRWSPEALSAYILGDEEGGTPLRGDGDRWMQALADADRHELEDGWRHWLDRGWYPSDQYYVASRRWQYADVDDPDGAIRTTAVSRFLDTDGPPPPEALPDGPAVELGEPAPPGDRRISELLVQRRSGRAYVPKPVPMEVLSGILWHGVAHVRRRRERTEPLRPLSYLDSFGSAWDFHLCVYAVTGLAAGTYRYDIDRHVLVGVRPGDHRRTMTGILQGMRSPMTAAWTLGLVADFPRYQWRYRHEHGLRRLYLESGILGQELVVLGSSYGLSALVTPAQKDRPYLSLHGLSDDRYAPIYTLTMGMSRGRGGIDFGSEYVDARDASRGNQEAR